MRHLGVKVILISAIAVLAVASFGQQQTSVDLFTALRSGQISAEFRGAGESAVTGTIRSTDTRLSQLTIPPGTQFQGQIPGRQGMNSVQPQRFGLNPSGETKITIATACTDLGLPSPTLADIMNPMPCPDQRLSRIAGVVSARSVPAEVAQIAVWAIANNPPPGALQVYLGRVVTGVPVVAEPKRRELMGAVANLLTNAGLDPGSFLMFQSGPERPQPAAGRPNSRQQRTTHGRPPVRNR